MPLGLSQMLDDAVVFPVSSIRADQKLVSFKDFPCGKSRMKCPNCSCVQYPVATALDVQTYVFCYELMISYILYVLKDRQTNGQIVRRCREFAEILYVCPFIDHHGEMSGRYVVEGNFLKIKPHTEVREVCRIPFIYA